MVSHSDRRGKIVLELDAMVVERLRGIAARWHKVERNLKRIENLRGQIAIPSINELRYAGRAIVDGLVILLEQHSNDDGNPDRESFEALMIEAKSCCETADHDIVDAIVVYLSDRLALLVDEFGLKNIALYFPAYTSIRKTLRDVQEKIAYTREYPSERESIYNELMVKLDDLFEFDETVRTAEDQMLKVVDGERLRERKQHFWRWTERIISLVALLIAGIALAYALW